MDAYVPPFRMTDTITELISEISEQIGILSVDTHFSPDPYLRRESRIQTIHSSLAIEQNTLSLAEVTAVLDGKRVLGPPKDIQEVKNAFDAYESMASLDPCSMEDLLTAHRLMMRDLIPDAGCFRSGNVGVFRGDQLIHAGTPARYVPEVMAQLFAWLRTTTLHPLVRGCLFHFEFETIHPFSDGNGRTGRLWHSLILQGWRPILAWLPVENLVREHQEEYYSTLNAGQRQGDGTDFVTFMLRMLRDTLAEIRRDQDSHVVDDVANNVVDEQGRLQQSLLTILRQRPKASAREIAALLDRSPRHIQRLLADLKAQGTIVRNGSPRNGFWEIAVDSDREDRP